MNDLTVVENDVTNLTGLDNITAGYIDNCPVIRIVDGNGRNIGHAYYNKNDWTILTTYISNKWSK